MELVAFDLDEGFMIEELIGFQSVNLVRPPAQGERLVGVLDYLRLFAKLWNVYMLSKDFINMLKIAKA